MIERGFAFWTHHVNVVVSDPQKDPQRVVIVNLTSCKAEADRKRVDTIFAGEHPDVTKDSYVAYPYALAVALAVLNRGLASRKSRPAHPFSRDLLARIYRGAPRFMKQDLVAVLEAQGFLKANH